MPSQKKQVDMNKSIQKKLVFNTSIRETAKTDITPSQARQNRLKKKLINDVDTKVNTRVNTRVNKIKTTKVFDEIARRCPGLRTEFDKSVKSKQKNSVYDKTPNIKHPYFDQDIGEIVENLEVGNDESDANEDVDSENELSSCIELTKDGYKKDDFVADDTDESYNEEENCEDSEDSEDSKDSKNSEDCKDCKDGEYEKSNDVKNQMERRKSLRTNKHKNSEILDELNQLMGDFIDDKDIDSDERDRRNNVMKHLRDIDTDKVTIEKVITQRFNDADNQWFYTELKRMRNLEGRDRFMSEDAIQKRFSFLTALMQSGVYDLHAGTDRSDRDILTEIVVSKFSNSIKTTMIEKLQSITQNASPEEYQKNVQWLDTVLRIPTDVKNSDRTPQTIVSDLHKSLKSKMTEMDETIFSVLQAVSSILSDQSNRGYMIALLGPPGVGKTTISNMIADISGMGYGHISCGSINDQSTLIGHGSIYIGSKPGVFLQTIISSKQLNNVIVLDELDKIEDSKIVPILLQLLDPSQNKQFRDAYCPEIPIDMSKNLYIVTLNSLEGLDKALIDRMKIINVKQYNVEQQISICFNHIVPDLNMRYGLNIKIDKPVIDECIKKYVFKMNTTSPSIRRSVKRKLLEQFEQSDNKEKNGMRDAIRFFSDIFERSVLIEYLDSNNQIINKIKTAKKSLTITDIEIIKSYEKSQF
jgi:ATP-dependent Lon protease